MTSVTAGTQLGPYVVVDVLGVGGMGEVWKARDTRLDRLVAIKVLPEQLSRDLKSRQRFILEAQAAASLNHENICTVYEVDTERWLLVMELVEGETVRDRVARGPLPIRQALDIATQAATGLAAAHEKGIVHRDIKPGNLMVTGHGRLKVMDFGLARSDDRTQITNTGVKLGTPAYMSPEQVRGELVDRRTDIWALGAVLFECIAGRRAFPGETPEAMLHAIVNSEPEPLTAVRSGIPLELERIVRKAMAKVPEARYQHVDDLLVDLRAVSSTLSQTGSSGIVGGTPMEVRRLRRQRTVLLVALASVIAATLIGYLMLRRGEPPATAVQFSVDPPAGMTFALGPSAMRLSPDGKRLVFMVIGADGLPRTAIRSFDSARSRVLAGTESANWPFWSADGSRVGYVQAGLLKTLPADGGTPVTVCEWTGSMGGAAWSQHGIILFSDGKSGELMKVNAAGGRPEAVIKRDESRGEIAHLNPVFLPDGKRFLYRSETKDGSVIFVGTLDSVERRFVVNSNSPPQYSTKPGALAYLLFAQNLSLYAYRFDLRTTRIEGDPIRVLADELIETAAYSAAQSGTLAYRIGGEQRSRLTITDRKGDALREVGPAGDYRQIRVSSDGRKAVVSRVPPNGSSSDISMVDMSSGASTRLTFSNYANWSPQLSHDQSSVYFIENRPGQRELIRISTSRPSAERSAVTQLTVGGSDYDWSRDGRFLITTRDTDLWMMARDRPEKRTQLTNTPANEFHAVFSPSSRYFAYTSNESGETQVYVAELAPAFDAIVNRWEVSVAGGSHPRWHGSGKELFYIGRDKKLMSVPVVLGSAFTHSPPRPLFATKLPLMFFLFPYDVIGDNFLLNIPVDDPAAAKIVATLNWEPDRQR